jgi:tetratricopeptide (TPR) repeat protein
VTDISSRKILGQNQLTFQRLRVSLSLNLRRQIFVAVCDDLLLRDRLAAQLQTELAKSKVDSRRYPRLVSLNLNLNDPNPIVQIAQWLRQNPPPTANRRVAPMPAFQIMGVEQLTRQSAATQRLFFTHLQSIEHSLPLLESSILIWTTQPWFRTLPQSAPDFWRCRTGIFEFIGDPTPLQNSGTWEIGTSGSNIRLDDLPQRGQLDRPDEDETDRYDLDRRWRSEEPAEEYSTASSLPIVISIPPKTAARTQTAVAVQVAAAEERGSSVITLLPPVEVEETTPLELLSLPQQIEQLQRHNASPDRLVEAYRNFGNLYRDRIEQGDASPENITTAIQSYEKVLPLLPEASPLWVDILNDLGSLYWMLSRTPFDLAIALHHLKKGILAYQLALTKVDVEAQAEVYPMVQCNLGAAYTDLARHQDPAPNLALAVRAYQEALRLRGEDVDTRRYASTQNNLGTTYWNLAQHQDPQTNLKEAIAAYSAALCHYDPDEEPLNYAMIQNNLGTAYWNLAQHERPQDWLSLAIAAYQIALQYRTVSAAPAAFAATQNNLGTAYWHMANQVDSPTDKLNSLRQAIVAYEAALETAAAMAKNQTDPSMPATLSFDLFATYNNLGLAYYQVATDSKAGLDSITQSAYLESAMRHHIQAYQGWAPRPDLQPTAFSCMVQTCRAFYSQLGMVGQNLALSMIPGQLLPEVLPKL